jgi:cytochrome o ubiquinol oxidase subunit 1
MMRMPVFTWTALCTNVLIVAIFPVLTATLALLLTLDRYLGTNFFTNDLGGNAMMYVNLIWIWGHPEVYILILPCFGIYSEIAATFSASACSAIPRWSTPPSASRACPIWSGCTTSSPWARAPA